MSKEKERPVTMKDLEEMAQAWEEKFQSLPKKTGEQSLSSTKEQSEKNGGGDATPKYKCKGKNCGFYTDDGVEMVLHMMEEHSAKPNVEEEAPPTESKTKHPMTAQALVNCPDCRKRLTEEFDKIGYSVTPKKEPEPEKKEEKPKKKGGFLGI